MTRRVTRGAAPQKGSPEGTSGTRPCLQGVVCYTLETQPEKSEIFSAAGVALSEPWREESPAPAPCVSGVFSRQGDSGGGHPNQAVTAVTAVNLTGRRAPGLPTHFEQMWFKQLPYFIVYVVSVIGCVILLSPVF